MKQPVIIPPKQQFWTAVSNRLIPALQKQDKPAEKSMEPKEEKNKQDSVTAEKEEAYISQHATSVMLDLMKKYPKPKGTSKK